MFSKKYTENTPNSKTAKSVSSRPDLPSEDSRLRLALLPTCSSAHRTAPPPTSTRSTTRIATVKRDLIQRCRTVANLLPPNNFVFQKCQHFRFFDFCEKVQFLTKLSLWSFGKIRETCLLWDFLELRRKTKNIPIFIVTHHNSLTIHFTLTHVTIMLYNNIHFHQWQTIYSDHKGFIPNPLWSPRVTQPN